MIFFFCPVSLGLWQSVHIDDLRRSKDMISDMAALQNLTISQMLCEDSGKTKGELYASCASQWCQYASREKWRDASPDLVLVDPVLGTTYLGIFTVQCLRLCRDHYMTINLCFYLVYCCKVFVIKSDSFDSQFDSFPIFFQEKCNVCTAQHPGCYVSEQ